MDEVAAVKDSLKDELPSTAIYEKRKDLPAYNWGGPGYAYLAQDVKQIVQRQRLRDEL
jgi:membrane dipeptidase